MKKILLTTLAILAISSQSFAGEGLSAWEKFSDGTLADADLIAGTDVSDTDQSNEGSSKAFTFLQLRTALAAYFAGVLTSDQNYVSDAQLVVIGNTSGTNTGDNATNTQYSGLATSKQDADADLTDLADGSLTGSKVGTGINGDNITSGTVADARIASTIARDSEIPTSAGSLTIIATGFDGNLATTDDTVQELAQKVDDLVIPTDTDNQTASEVSVTATGFDGNLATTDNTVQKVAQKVDDLVLGSGGATAINDLTDVDTTGKATGKVLKFDASGNMVVGDDEIGASGTGDITGVTAGTGLTGGGDTGAVTVGLSQATQDAIAANTAKVSFDSTTSTRLANTSGTNTGDVPVVSTVRTTVGGGSTTAPPSEAAVGDEFANKASLGSSSNPTFGIVTATNYISSTTTGAPFTVASNQVVTNLNASLLDGLGPADFALEVLDEGTSRDLLVNKLNFIGAGVSAVENANHTIDVTIAGGSTEVVDEAFSAANFDGATTSGVSQDDFYDRMHLFDADDDGSFTDEAWFPSTTGAPTSASYLTSTAEAGLSAEANLGALTTGLLKITVAAGSATPSTAVAGTDYQAPLTNPVVQANLGTGMYTFLATPTVANFFSAVTGEGAFAATLFGYADAATTFAGIKQAATESATGVVELATTTEATTGTDTARAVTPAGVKAVTDQFWSAGTDGTRRITFGNNPSGIAPTASVYEQYVDNGVWKLNTNGTETFMMTAQTGPVAMVGNAGGSSQVTVPNGTVNLAAGTVAVVDGALGNASATSLSFGADPADSGAVRLSNNTAIYWEAATPGTDIPIAVDGSNIIQMGQNAAGINFNSAPITGFSLAATAVTFSDPDSLFTATNVNTALAEFNDSINAGAPNGTGAKVHWSQLLGVPAGFADGSDDGAGGTPTAITVADTTDTTSYVALFESATGDLGPKTDAGLTYNAGTGMLTATGFTGPLTGTASIAATGDSATSFFSTGTLEASLLPAASDTAAGASEYATTAETTTGTATNRSVTPDGLSGSVYGQKEIGWSAYDSDVSTAVADGKVGAAIPASMNGMNLIDVTCSTSDITGATSGTTTVVLRRVRGATAVDMTSTGVTIDYNAYTASDETVDTSNDDVATGDKIFVDVNAVSAGAAAKGLYCTAVFQTP